MLGAAKSALLPNNTSRLGWLRLAEIGFDTRISGSLRGNMLRQFFVGGGVSLINIAIHALVMTTVVRVAQATNAKVKSHTSLLLMAVMIPTVSVLMATHVLEVIVWSLAYSIVDAAAPGANLAYFAFVNYTTLGYGDILPVERWRLLGPITAMNGVLLFGWSTAVIFEVLRKTITPSSS
jgi:Ion channel